MAAPLVIGTTNPAKARNIRAALQDMPYELLEPNEALSELPEVNEEAVDVEQNALRKAIAFAAAANLPAISLDYGLYFDGLPDEAQPGVNVRRIPGTERRPSDEELLRYYADLFARHGGEVHGRPAFRQRAECRTRPRLPARVAPVRRRAVRRRPGRGRRRAPLAGGAARAVALPRRRAPRPAPRKERVMGSRT